MARRKPEPIYTTIEPVSVVPLSDSEDVRRALLETIARKNVIIRDPDPTALRAPPLILKYAGVKSGLAFFRRASMWAITQDDGVFRIINPKGHYQQEPAQEIQFSVGTTVDSVVDRIIAMLQEAARAATN